MMKKEIFLLIISVLLYMIAPDYYDKSFTILCTCIFILGAVFTLDADIKKGNILSFNIIFFFSYFWTTFAYPLFIYGTYHDRDNAINEVLNWELLSHTSALGLVFICAYICGYSKLKDSGEFSSCNTYESIKNPKFVFFIVAVIYLITAIYGYSVTGSSNMEIGKFLVDVYFALFILLLFYNIYTVPPEIQHTLKNFYQINRMPITVGVLFFIVVIVLGDRGPAIKTILIIVSAYYFFWQKISIRRLVPYGLIFLLLLFFVRATRGGDESLSSGKANVETVKNAFDLENGYIYVFADLFYINRELCLGYEYAQNHPLFHPERILLIPFHPIPGLPSFVCKVFSDYTPAQMDTGEELNNIVVSNVRYEVGHLGNHPASDLLMSFGLVGMIIIAYLLGYFVNYIDLRKNTSFLYGCYFLTLVCWSLYLPRSYVFMLVRPIGYILLITLFTVKKK